MQLNKDTIKKLELLKSETEAKILEQRANILKFVTVDTKYQVIIDARCRDSAKEITESIFALQQRESKLEALIANVKEAAEQLNCLNFDFAGMRTGLSSTLATHEQFLKRGVLQEILSKEKADELESKISEMKKQLKRYDEVVAPLLTRLDTVPDVTSTQSRGAGDDDY